MRILLCSHVFAPSIGGIETVSRILAEQFSRMGATVTVVTQTPGDRICSGYEVVRRPSIPRLLKLGRRADIVFESNISLRTILPLLLCGKPIVIAHHGPLTRIDGRIGWQDRVKCALLPACHNVAISDSIASRLPVNSKVIGNPFEADQFARNGAGNRDKDFVFLGRLVSDKGCDLAVRALALLKDDGLCASFTVIGDGPELPGLKRLSAELGVAEQVRFCGAMRAGRGAELARHKVMVIPSVWAEPFGVVALEGIAAGCVLAASNTGGLPEAVGPCGLLFPNGDIAAMGAALKRLTTDPRLRQNLLTDREKHLARFQPQVAARCYMELFASVLHSHK